MKKTLSIHLGRQLFVIEEDAFDRLQQYLDRLTVSLNAETGVAEIIEDIEMRFAELLVSYMGETRKVVTIADIEKGIVSLGEPEVISEETAQNTQEEPKSRPGRQAAQNRRFFRDPENGILAGVAAGAASYLGLDPLIVRILFVLFSFAGFGIPLYLILWIIVPNASTPSERLQMQGKPITVDTLKDEFAKATDRIKDDTLRARDRVRENQDHIMKRARAFTRVLLKIFGIGMICAASLWLIFFLLTVSGVLSFIPTSGEPAYLSFYGLMQLVSPVKSTFDLLWTGILLVGLGGPLLLILWGARILMERPNRFFKISFILFPVVIAAGIFCGIVGSFQVTRDFSVYSEVEHEKWSVNADELTIEELPHYTGNRLIVSTGGLDVLNIHNHRIYEGDMVLITYRPSPDSLFHVMQVFSARGVNRTAALKHSERMRHVMKLSDGKLYIDAAYSYPMKDGFRDQEVEVIIEIPAGKILNVKNFTIENPDRESHGRFYADEPFEPWPEGY